MSWITSRDIQRSPDHYEYRPALVLHIVHHPTHVLHGSTNPTTSTPGAGTTTPAGQVQLGSGSIKSTRSSPRKKAGIGSTRTSTPSEQQQQHQGNQRSGLVMPIVRTFAVQCSTFHDDDHHACDDDSNEDSDEEDEEESIGQKKKESNYSRNTSNSNPDSDLNSNSNSNNSTSEEDDKDVDVDKEATEWTETLNLNLHRGGIALRKDGGLDIEGCSTEWQALGVLQHVLTLCKVESIEQAPHCTLQVSLGSFFPVFI